MLCINFCPRVDLKRYFELFFPFLECVHEGLKEYVCDHCGRGFNKSGNLNTHIKNVHFGLKNFQCAFCNTAYGEKRNLENHVAKNHPGMKLSVGVTQVSKQNLEWNKKYMEYLNIKKDAKSEIVKSKTNVDVNNRYGRGHKLTHIF